MIINLYYIFLVATYHFLSFILVPSFTSSVLLLLPLAWCTHGWKNELIVTFAGDSSMHWANEEVKKNQKHQHFPNCVGRWPECCAVGQLDLVSSYYVRLNTQVNHTDYIIMNAFVRWLSRSTPQILCVCTVCKSMQIISRCFCCHPH